MNRDANSAPDAVKIDHAQSNTIRIARVLCIFFMSSQHAWPGSERMLLANVPAATHAFYLVVVDFFGRASVPFLSLISGLLVVNSLRSRGPKLLMKNKFQTLILPMMAWSIPMIAILHLEPIITHAPPLSWSVMDWINSLFAITRSPANGPLHFFRDVFIMAGYACVILYVYDRNRMLGMALAVFIALLEQKAGGFLLFRNQIAFLYVIGMLFVLTGHINWRPSWWMVAVGLAVYFGAYFFDLVDEHSSDIFVQRLSQLVPRIAVSLFMWRMAYEIGRRESPFRSLIMFIEPHIFVVFCSHALVVKGFGLVANKLHFTEADPIVPAFLLLQMVSFVVIGVALSYLLRPFPTLRGKGGKSKSAKGQKPELSAVSGGAQ